MVERLDDSQTKFLALLILRNSNVFDMADETHVVDKLALDNDSAGTDDGLRGIENDEDEVGGKHGGDEVVSLEKSVIAGLANGSEDAEGVEEACIYICVSAWGCYERGGCEPLW